MRNHMKETARKFRGRAPAMAFLAALLAAASSVGAFPPEGCFATNPPSPATPNPCTYTATQPGGVDAIRGWTVTIVRGEDTITLENGVGDKRCVVQGIRTVCSIGTIRPGDFVTATASAPGSIVAVGNPCPVIVPPGDCSS